MENLNSSQLIERIEDAKEWLDKAKDEYSKENPVRGGLILSLAQAEVRHAWELSNQQFVKTNHKMVQTKRSKYFLPVAASFILFASLVIGVQVTGRFVKNKSGILPKTSVAVNKKPDLPLKVETDSKQLNNNFTTEKAVSEQANSAILTQRNHGTVEKKTPVVMSKFSNPRKTEITSQDGASKVVPSKTVVKPVSQFIIDEEALTREAKHSLQNGKY